MTGFLANENIPQEAIKALRSQGVDIISATESYRGKDDLTLLNESAKLKRILITFDKDFGELAFHRDVVAPYGVILMRFKPKSAEHVRGIMSRLLERDIELQGHFTVVTENKIRVIPLEK